MEPTETSVPVCYRHPDRITGLSCVRCGRNICVECSHDAAVGQVCPDHAVSQDRHRVVQARSFLARPTFATAPVSFSILGITIGIFLLGYAPALGQWFEDTFKLYTPLIAAGEWWRIFTPVLVHGGFLHVGFNMYALYLFGPRLEQQVGSTSFAALYLACAGAGGVASYLFGDPFIASIGASGAIFGLLGAWLVASWKMRDTPGGRSMFNTLFFLLAINLVLGFVVPGIDWRAHVGGLMAGAGIAYLWSLFAVGRPNAVAIRTAIAAAVIGLDIAAVLLLTPF